MSRPLMYRSWYPARPPPCKTQEAWLKMWEHKYGPNLGKRPVLGDRPVPTRKRRKRAATSIQALARRSRDRQAIVRALLSHYTTRIQALARGYLVRC